MIRASHLRFGFIPLICSVAFLVGCSGSPSAEGSVTLDGQPVEDGTITFFPEAGSSHGPNVPGEIKDGKYAIDSSRNLKPGLYKVEIYWFKKTGKQLPNPNDPGTKIDEAKQLIADEYNRNSKLKVEIKGGGTNTHNFELKSGGVISRPGPGPASGGKVNDETQPNRK
jgi:hypothetical protein